MYAYYNIITSIIAEQRKNRKRKAGLVNYFQNGTIGKLFLCIMLFFQYCYSIQDIMKVINRVSLQMVTNCVGLYKGYISRIQWRCKLVYINQVSLNFFRGRPHSGIELQSVPDKQVYLIRME